MTTEPILTPDDIADVAQYSPVEQLVLAYATYAHRDQKRKYTFEPYINHCVNVAKMVKQYGGTEEMVCAALLHDTIEDTEVTSDTLLTFLFLTNKGGLFVNRVHNWTHSLTDIYTAKDFPSLNRKERKELELYLMKDSPPEVQTIKYCDLIDNTSTIVQYDPKFAEVYLQEKRDLLAVMTRGNPELRAIALNLANPVAP